MENLGLKQSHSKTDRFSDVHAERNDVVVSRRTSVAIGTVFCGCWNCCNSQADTLSPFGDGLHGSALMKQLFAATMDSSMQEYENSIASVKVRLFNDIFEMDDTDFQGSYPRRLVDVGVGTGPNLRYFSHIDNLKIVGVDPNPYMRPYLMDNMNSLDVNPNTFEWRDGVAENLPIESGTLDAAISTLVMCSVQDVEKSISEIYRVLRPGGKYVFIEHVAAPEDHLWLGIAQRVFDPLQQLLADNCHLRRDPLPFIQHAGFRSIDFERFDVKGMSLIAPHLAGVAVK